MKHIPVRHCRDCPYGQFNNHVVVGWLCEKLKTININAASIPKICPLPELKTDQRICKE